ncbi:isochorismatase [Cercophora newfieldiana]|uniref:Isochorismatase n=1 Tax=Cercophora newfieldiana TaxID=92897 RepID=A0AA40CPP4_9PEZI|nr:isochorismatase [Cercophora newfieldiana]
MKLTSILSAALAVGSALADSFAWERLEKDKALLLVVDLQEGLYTLARDWDPTLYKHNMIAHAGIGAIFELPTILTTSAETGPNGPLPQEIYDLHPNAPVIRRGGEVNAWDNAEFREAVRATNRTHIILAGLVTDVCTAFLARSLRAEGYQVWANIEASGTTTELIRDISNQQMLRAGVNVVSLFAIACDLMRDWRNVPGAIKLYPWLDKYFPVYGMMARAHTAAIRNGTVTDAAALLPN